jgi:hypothetical protein
LEVGRALKEAFSHVPDKEQALLALIDLMRDEYSFVDPAFLTQMRKNQHKNRSIPFVRTAASSALKEAFSHVPYNKQAYQDLLQLMHDEDSHVRMYAYIITEIQSKSKALCRTTYGSEIFQPLGTDLNKLAQGLSPKDLRKCQKISMRMVPLLQELCTLLRADKRGHGCDIVAEIRTEDELPGILNRILEAMTYLQPNIEITALESRTTQMFKDIQTELEVVNNKLDEIRYAIFKQRIHSGNVISNLTAINTELEKLYQISLQHPNRSLKELYSCREEQLQELNRDMDARFAELKALLKEKASTDDVKKILGAFERLEPSDTWNSKFWDLADKGATLLTFISLLQGAIAILRHA